MLKGRLHTTFGIYDKMLLNCNCRCQALGNSTDIGSASHLNGSNNHLKYLV